MWLTDIIVGVVDCEDLNTLVEQIRCKISMYLFSRICVSFCWSTDGLFYSLHYEWLNKGFCFSFLKQNILASIIQTEMQSVKTNH